MNIRLRSDAQGGNADLTRGGYFRGDGLTTDASANAGLPLGRGGFLNLTANVRDHGFSNAGGPDQRVVSAVASGAHPEWRQLADYPLVNKVIGDAQYRSYVGMFNGELPLEGLGQLYAFGSYGHKKAGGWANFRLPTRLPTLYPKGFSPIEWVVADDLSLTTGLRADFAAWSLDVSASRGFNHNRVEVTGSANVDLYRDTGSTPFDFYNGNLDGGQWIVNVDARRPLDLGLSSPATFAAGFEYRRETYAIVAGDEASRYKAGSQSFPGFALSDAGSTARDVEAGYVDLALSPSEALKLDVAGRAEHYSDFGSAVVGKVSVHFDLNDRYALRGTASNGFRAPTLA